ncbi:MAG TPA: hypothetical protein VFK43_13225, partial [Acidimicrobiales bacterium]|nr:hypothetical protein [Acidimicrobiales bacterium]
ALERLAADRVEAQLLAARGDAEAAAKRFAAALDAARAIGSAFLVAGTADDAAGALASTLPAAAAELSEAGAEARAALQAWKDGTTVGP